MEKVKNKERKKIIGTIIFSIVFWELLFILFAYIGIEGSNPWVVISFLANGILFYCMMVYSLRKRAYSLDLIHAFFLFSFMFIAPFIQYISGVFPWDTSFPDSTVLQTNLLLDLWAAVYLLIKHFPLPRKKREKGVQIKENVKAPQTPWVNKKFLIFCVVVSILIAIVLFAKNGTSMFSRATNNSLNFSNTSLTLLATISVRSFITAVTVLTIYNLKYRKKVSDWILLLIQLVALLIVCFPTGMARYQMATIYVGLLLILFPFFRKGPWFLFMMAFGLIIIFPIINAFRRIAFGEVNLIQTAKEAMGSLIDAFLKGDYDAYTMFMMTQNYVVDQGITYGAQLLGVFLFFVPRKYWPAKPVGSGQTVAEFYSWSFTNLSSPLPAEGYINFGIWGIVLFAAVLSLIIRIIDHVFWRKRNGAINFIYPFIVILLFFMMRGDLLSSFAYTFGTAFIFLCVYALNAICVKHSGSPLFEKNSIDGENSLSAK